MNINTILSEKLALSFFAIYIVIAIAIGIFCARREGEEGFMIADRRVRGIQMIATVTAGIFDGAILSIYIAYVYQYGMAAMWFFVGLSIGFIIFRHYASKIKVRSDEMKVYSMPEYFYKIYGRRTGIMFSILLIIQFFGYLTVNFIISGKVLFSIFPSLGYRSSVVIGGCIILTYTVLAGLKAVVKTDFFQLIIMIVMCFTVWMALGPGQQVTAADLSLTSMGVGDTIGFLVISALGILVAPDLWQRAFAADNVRTLRSGFTYGALILPILALIITVVGLTTKHYIPGLKAEDALVTGFLYLLPPIIKEAGIVLLYAVALSSSDTVTFVVGSIIARDLKNYTSTFNDASARKLTRVFMLMFVVAAIAIAANYQSILSLAFALASLNLALFPVVFSTFYWKLKEAAVFWSLSLTLVGIAAIAAVQPLTPETASFSFPIALISLATLQMFWRKKLNTEKVLSNL